MDKDSNNNNNNKEDAFMQLNKKWINDWIRLENEKWFLEFVSWFDKRTT